MPPRATLVSVAVGFICASSAAPMAWWLAARIRQHQHQVVGLAQQGGLVDVAGADGRFLLGAGGCGCDRSPHAEAQRAAPRDGLPDAAHAQDAQRGAVHVGAGEHVVGPAVHSPRRRKRSLSAMRRAAAIISAKPKSAVVSVSTSGVLVASTPRAVQAGMSMLL
jgi:hypothetical protein